MIKILFCRREGLTFVGRAFALLVVFFVFHYTLLIIESQQQGGLASGKHDKKLHSYVPPGKHDKKTHSYVRMKPKRKMATHSNKTRGKSTGKKNAFLKDHVIEMEEHWTEEKMEAQNEVFKQRMSHMSAACAKLEDKDVLRPNISQVHANIRWVKKHHLIWCPVYKAASTTWMNNLLLLAGIKFANMSLHRRVRELYPPPEDPQERENLLQTSLRMLIVRHPLKRLLSAYRDKMLREDQFKRLRASIRSKYPDPKASEDTGKHPTFRQFLMFIRDEMKRFWKTDGRSPVNNHWQPVWWACGPCQVSYDTIAHVETLAVDQEYIIQKAGITNLVFNAHTHASNFDSYNGTTQASKIYFSQVPQKLLKDVADLYRPDFDLFGYSPTEYIQLANAPQKTKKATRDLS